MTTFVSMYIRFVYHGVLKYVWIVESDYRRYYFTQKKK